MTPSPSSVFVVSGGARGITAGCIIALAERYRCTFLLLGRSAIIDPEPAWAMDCTDEAALTPQIITDLQAQGEPATPVRVQQVLHRLQASRTIRATMEAIRQAGGQAHYLAVDITDRQDLQPRLATALQSIGPVTGIIHGAGVLADRLIEKKTAADFEAVYSVKVTGLHNLLACVPVAELDYLMLFSSVTGFYGNVGQADYAIANETLNKLAHQIKHAHPDCRVLCFDWGPWDSGMVTPELKQLFEQQQIAVIPSADGTRAFVREVAAAHDQVQIIVGSPLGAQHTHLGPVLDMLRARRNLMRGSAPLPAASQLRTHTIRRTLTLAANPALHDHVIGAHAVLPAAFSVAWIANACEQIYPGYVFARCEDYRVLKGIVFDAQLAHEYVLAIEEISLDAAAKAILVDALIWSAAADDRQRYHYRGRFTLRRKLPAAPTYPALKLDEQQPIDGSQLYARGVLFHGPAFQGVTRVLNSTSAHLTLACVVPDIPLDQQGQFPIQTYNPYMADVAIQSIVVWLHQFRQTSGLPTGMRCFEQYRALAPNQRFYVSLAVQTCSAHAITTDLTIHDADGLIYAQMWGAEAAISQHLGHLFAQATTQHISSTAPPQPEQTATQPPPAQSSAVLLDETALLEFADGQASTVFGDTYAALDTYPRRVRLPLPPYLLISRVTDLQATRGSLTPCSITTEYDIPDAAWYAVDGQVPYAIATEGGQGILLLLGFLGIDVEHSGQRVYRQLDSTITFTDVFPTTGQTLRYTVTIRAFARNGDQLLVFSDYDCFCGDQLILRMENGCAGFFSTADLDEARGIVAGETTPAACPPQPASGFVPPLTCQKTTFDAADLRALSAGDIAACFGASYGQPSLNQALRLPPPAMLLLDRVVVVAPDAGAAQGGLLIAEQDITPDDWFFASHFKHDPVMPASLMAEACHQLLQFYLLFLGMQMRTSQARFQPIPGLAQVMRFRGQVTPACTSLTYRMEITDRGLTPEPYAIGCAEIVHQNRTIATLSALGLRLIDTL